MPQEIDCVVAADSSKRGELRRSDERLCLDRLSIRPPAIPVEPVREFSSQRASANFLKGMAAPVSTMFSSKESFLLGVGAIGVSALMIAAVPKVALVFAAAGLGYGTYLTGRGIYNLVTGIRSTDPSLVEESFRGMGEGIGTGMLAASGARGSAMAAGVGKTSDSVAKASLLVVRSAPRVAGEVVATIRSGDAKRMLLTKLRRPTNKLAAERPDSPAVRPAPSFEYCPNLGDEGGAGFFPSRPKPPPGNVAVVAKGTIAAFGEAPPIPNIAAVESIPKSFPRASVGGGALAGGHPQWTPSNQAGAAQGANALKDKLVGQQGRNSEQER